MTPYIERQSGPFILREYPLVVARVRETKRREAGEVRRK